MRQDENPSSYEGKTNLAFSVNCVGSRHSTSVIVVEIKREGVSLIVSVSCCLELTERGMRRAALALWLE